MCRRSERASGWAPLTFTCLRVKKDGSSLLLMIFVVEDFVMRVRARKIGPVSRNSWSWKQISM